MSDLIKKLSLIQSRLKAPKLQFNDFGNFKYRSCEDILEAVKPHLEEQGLLLTITDEVVMVGSRYYVKALATITDGESEKTIVGYAREEEKGKAGMDGSQVTGASSSYARKYALNGLFLIDDTKDSDFTNKGNQQPVKEQKDININNVQPMPAIDKFKSEIMAIDDVEELRNWWRTHSGLHDNAEVKKLVCDRGESLKNK